MMDEDGNEVADQDHDEWETSSEQSDVAEDLMNPLNPLEDVIARSLAALNPSASPSNTPTSAQSNTQGTPSSSAPAFTNDHVIGMNRRTAEFISALDQSFSPKKNAEDGGGSSSKSPSEGESVATRKESGSMENTIGSNTESANVKESTSCERESIHSFFSLKGRFFFFYKTQFMYM